MEESNPQAFAGYHCNLIATACNPSSGFAANRAIRSGNYNPRSREIDAKARLFPAGALAAAAIKAYFPQFGFRSNPHYDARWSPEIYSLSLSLSHYVNEQGSAFRSIISVDWGLRNQIYALAPTKLRKHVRDYWPSFREMGKKTQQQQSATLNYIFPDLRPSSPPATTGE
jgi:hypothetical protein